MKNLIKILRLFALVTVIGFSMAACDDGNGGGGGGGGLAGTTWKLESGATLTFIDASSVKLEYPGGTENGTYTFNGSSGVFTWSDGDSDSFVVNGSTLTSSGLTFTKTGSSGGGTGGGSGSGGTFTLTDIPSQYNGKYAAILGVANDAQTFVLKGYQDININRNPPYTLSSISNRQVSMPMWILEVGSNPPYKRYSGNYTCTGPLVVTIYNSQDQSGTSIIGWISFDQDYYYNLRPVTFSNGSATKSWNDGVWTQR